jgi:hypothetical protein
MDAGLFKILSPKSYVMKFEDHEKRQDHSGHHQPSTSGTSGDTDSRSTQTREDENANRTEPGGGQQDVASDRPERERSTDRTIGTQQNFGTDAFGSQED